MMHLDPLLETTYTHVLYIYDGNVNVVEMPITPDSTELAVIGDVVTLVDEWMREDSATIVALVDWADVDERERKRLLASVDEHQRDALTLSSLFSDDAQT